MNEKIITSLKSFLIWFSVFYLAFMGIQYFMGDQKNSGEKIAVPNIEIIPINKSVVLGNLAEFTVKNNTDKTITLINCGGDQAPVSFARMINGQLLALTKDQPCLTKNIEKIAPNSAKIASFPEINSQLFTEEGNYSMTARFQVEGSDEVLTVLSRNIEFSQPGMFRNLFRNLVTKPLFNFLVWLTQHLPNHSLGWAIIILTITVRLILFIPNQKAMKSQRKLQKLQPKIEELRKKHGKNQQAMAMKTMELYKTHKINPMSSCLPMLIQMPFLIGIYFVVQDGISPHLMEFLYGFNSRADLSIVNNMFLRMDLSVPNIYVLPFLVGIAQWIALRLAFISSAKNNKNAPPSEGMAGQMQQMQKMMQWVFPVMICVFTFTFPAGVGLYWLVSTVFGIGQQQLVNKMLDNEPMVTRRS